MGSLAARQSKVIKEARLVRGKVYLILDASNEVGEDGWEGRRLSKGLLPPTDNQWAIELFVGGRWGLHGETAQSSSNWSLVV